MSAGTVACLCPLRSEQKGNATLAGQFEIRLD